MKFLKSIINGNFVKELIDNFDPYGIKAHLDIEFNKQYNEKTKLDSKEK